MLVTCLLLLTYLLLESWALIAAYRLPFEQPRHGFCGHPSKRQDYLNKPRRISILAELADKAHDDGRRDAAGCDGASFVELLLHKLTVDLEMSRRLKNSNRTQIQFIFIPALPGPK